MDDDEIRGILRHSVKVLHFVCPSVLTIIYEINIYNAGSP